MIHDGENENEKRFAEVFKIVKTAKDYWPKIPTPETYPCPIAGCDHVMGWRVEFVVHMRQEHPSICMYCLKEIPDLWRGGRYKSEHRVTKHQNLCPLCEDSDSYNFSTKILHLRRWHRNDERMQKEGISVYLR